MIRILFLIFVMFNVYAATVEIQWNVCEKNGSAILEKLNIDDVKTKKRELYFYDDSNLSLFNQGIVIRQRVNAGSTDLTVKVGVDSKFDSSEFKDEDGFKCEYDGHGQLLSYKCNFKVKEKFFKQEINLKNIFSKQQKNFLKASRPNLDIDSVSLVRMGFFQDEYSVFNFNNSEFSLNFYQHPKQNFLEISTRVELEDYEKSKDLFEKLFKQHGLNICEDQSGKTLFKLKVLQK